MEKDLVAWGYSRVVYEEVLERLQDATARSLLIQQEHYVISWHAELVQQEAAHRIDIIYAPAQRAQIGHLVLFNTN
jgi:predicted N-formylglutamate amidohydrolase